MGSLLGDPAYLAHCSDLMQIAVLIALWQLEQANHLRTIPHISKDQEVRFQDTTYLDRLVALSQSTKYLPRPRRHKGQVRTIFATEPFDFTVRASWFLLITCKCQIGSVRLVFLPTFSSPLATCQTTRPHPLFICRCRLARHD